MMKQRRFRTTLPGPTRFHPWYSLRILTRRNTDTGVKGLVFNSVLQSTIRPVNLTLRGNVFRPFRLPCVCPLSLVPCRGTDLRLSRLMPPTTECSVGDREGPGVYFPEDNGLTFFSFSVVLSVTPQGTVNLRLRGEEGTCRRCQ